MIELINYDLLSFASWQQIWNIQVNQNKLIYFDKTYIYFWINSPNIEFATKIHEKLVWSP